MKNLFKQAKDFAVEQARRRAIPVPQQAVNVMLPYLYRDVPEVQRLQVIIHDGYFVAEARVKKVVEVDATVRFEIDEVRLSAEEQIIRLRRTAATNLSSPSLAGKVALLVVEAVFLSILKVDPAHYASKDREGLTVEGDVFSIDLGRMGALDLIDRYPHVRELLKFGRIDEVRCVEGAFEAVPGVELGALGKHLAGKFRKGREGGT